MEPLSTAGSASREVSETSSELEERNAEEFFDELAISTAEQFKKEPPQYITHTQETHRFKGIECPLNTAVLAKVNGQTSYLHANRFRDYILTQSPIPTSTELFWSMCLKNSRLIVDLSNHEREHLDSYCPEEPFDVKTYGDFEITCVDKKWDAEAEIFLYKLVVWNKRSGKSKIVHRLNFPSWRARTGVDSFYYSKLIDCIDTYAGNEVVVVHCGAGVGRTGTLVTAREIHRLIANCGGKTDDYYRGKMQGVILAGRIARHPRFVESTDQIISLFHFIDEEMCDAWLKRKNQDQNGESSPREGKSDNQP